MTRLTPGVRALLPPLPSRGQTAAGGRNQGSRHSAPSAGRAMATPQPATTTGPWAAGWRVLRALWSQARCSQALRIQALCIQEEPGGACAGPVPKGRLGRRAGALARRRVQPAGVARGAQLPGRRLLGAVGQRGAPHRAAERRVERRVRARWLHTLPGEARAGRRERSGGLVEASGSPVETWPRRRCSTEGSSGRRRLGS